MKTVLHVLSLVTCIFGQDLCITPTGVNGRCISIRDCEKLKHLIKGSAWDREIVKQHQCGFQGHVPMVCCPNIVETVTTTITTTTTRTTTTILPPNKRCVTFDGKFGTCVKLENCPKLAKNIAHVPYFRCGALGHNVCCEKPIDENQDVTTKNPGDTFAGYSRNKCASSPGLPDPNGNCCGIESSSGNKIFNGDTTSIEEYPWLAMIEYITDNQWLCGGSLISSQHVLTAAHCIVKHNKPIGAKSVRLGEYDTKNDGPDCIEVDGGGEDCTDGAISIPIASVVVHPDYNSFIIREANDIALIKLSEMAPYNDFIRPICLPTIDITESPPLDAEFFAAGWGVVNNYTNYSDIKRHIVLPYVDHTSCKRAYTQGRFPQVWSKQICAGGEYKKDSCLGDSGGPLMYFNNTKYVLTGIISFGYKPCGIEGKPSVNTNVHAYIPWIKGLIN